MDGGAGSTLIGGDGHDTFAVGGFTNNYHSFGSTDFTEYGATEVADYNPNEDRLEITVYAFGPDEDIEIIEPEATISFDSDTEIYTVSLDGVETAHIALADGVEAQNGLISVDDLNVSVVWF